MLRQFKSSCGLSLRLLVVLLALSFMASCNKIPSFLTGGGPNVAANVQAGETNTQTLGTTDISNVDVKQSDNVVVSSDKNEVKSDGGPVTINKTEIDLWVLILLVVGWLAPSPQEIGKGLLSIVRRNK